MGDGVKIDPAADHFDQTYAVFALRPEDFYRSRPMPDNLQIAVKSVIAAIPMPTP